MKHTEPTIPGVLEQAFQLSPEAAKAQREAEMLNAHRYRAERMKQYKDWSDPEKRAQRLAQAAEEFEQAKKVWADEDFQKRREEQVKAFARASFPFAEQLKVTPIFKAAPTEASKPWYKRLLNHMKGSK